MIMKNIRFSTTSIILVVVLLIITIAISAFNSLSINSINKKVDAEISTQLNLLTYDLASAAYSTQGKLPEKYVGIISEDHFKAMDYYNDWAVKEDKVIEKFDGRIYYFRTTVNGNTALTEYGCDLKAVYDDGEITDLTAISYKVTWSLQDGNWIVTSIFDKYY